MGKLRHLGTGQGQSGVHRQLFKAGFIGFIVRWPFSDVKFRKPVAGLLCGVGVAWLPRGLTLPL